jgi:hypothetical protein
VHQVERVERRDEKTTSWAKDWYVEMVSFDCGVIYIKAEWG